MPVVVLRCPHCNAEQMTFDFAGQYKVRSADRDSRRFLDDPVPPGIWKTFFVCRRCKEGVVLKVVNAPRLGLQPSDCEDDLLSAGGAGAGGVGSEAGAVSTGVSTRGFTSITIHPKPTPIDVPDHVPDQIAENYTEATANLHQRHFTSAAMMLRRVLDRTTLELAPKARKAEFQKMRLSDRIAELPRERALTPTMREWADVIRLMGRDAEHRQDADEASATELHQFTELFLIYAFTLPGRVKAYRDQAQDKPKP